MQPTTNLSLLVPLVALAAHSGLRALALRALRAWRASRVPTVEEVLSPMRAQRSVDDVLRRFCDNCSQRVFCQCSACLKECSDPQPRWFGVYWLMCGKCQGCHNRCRQLRIAEYAPYTVPAPLSAPFRTALAELGDERTAEVVPKAKDAKELWADVRKAVRVLRPIALFWRVDARRSPSKLARFKSSSFAIIWSTDMTRELMDCEMQVDHHRDESASDGQEEVAWSGTTLDSQPGGEYLDFKGVRTIDRDMLPADAKARLIRSESCICVWKYGKHPPELVPYHFCFEGDEDWVALVPPMYEKKKLIGWLQRGGRFGCCDVSCNQCWTFPGYTVYVGCHA